MTKRGNMCVKRSRLLTTAAAIAAVVLFSAGAVVGASLTGPFKWSVVFGKTRLTAPIVLGPGGPYVASSAVAKLLDAKAVPDTASRTVTFFQMGALGPGQAANPTGGVLLQNWPNSLVLEGQTSGWTYVASSNPVSTDDGQTFQAGIEAAGLPTNHGAYGCSPRASLHASAGRVYITNGQYKSLSFSLALPATTRNGTGYAIVEVSTGDSISSMTRVYTSPHVTSGFLTQHVTVPINGAKLTEVITYVWQPSFNGNNCAIVNASVGVLLGNAQFLK